MSRKKVGFTTGPGDLSEAHNEGTLLEFDDSDNSLWVGGVKVAGGGGESVLKKATVTLTPTDILSLVATPFELVPAAGPGLLITPIAFVLKYRFGTTPYTTPAGVFLWGITDPINGNITGNIGTLANIIDQPNDVDAMSQGIASGTLIDIPVTVENQPLNCQTSSGVEVTDGDGTLEITTFYTIVDL